MNIETIKTVVKFVAALGVGSIVTNIISHTTPKNVKFLEKACIFVGGALLTDVAISAVSEQVDEQADDVVELVDEMKTKFKELKEGEA